MLGGRGDMARVAGLRRTTTGRLRPRRLRDGLQQPGGRHHRGVAAHDESDRAGLHPYSCLAFDITADGTAATDIEHIVALAETHDSGIADERRRDIASDLDNLTIADPTVNRSEKSDRDAADWMPARHGA